MTANTTTPPALRQMLTGFFISQALYVAAELGIADLLKDGPRSSEELARSVGADARSLYRLLRCLSSVGVFDEVKPNRFGLTSLGAPLQTDVPGSLRAYARYLGEEWYWRPWGNLLYSVRTGKPAFDHVFGTDMFEYLAQHPEASRKYSEGLGSRSAEDNAEITTPYDFSSMRRIVDVGAGRGSLLVSILKANPKLEGVLFDRPAVVEAAKPFIEAQRLSGRCKLVGGDFFETVPSGGDAYILQKVLHDWGDDQAVAILTSCNRAMPPRGKLLVCEMVLPPGNEPFVGKIQDLAMLILHPGGGERTAAEYQALFDAAGFTLARIVPTKTSISVIEGVRA